MRILDALCHMYGSYGRYMYAFTVTVVASGEYGGGGAGVAGCGEVARQIMV